MTIPRSGQDGRGGRGARPDRPVPALNVSGLPVAELRSGADVAPGLSPRAYLHPVRTLGGTAVTEVFPDDHRHHLGAGVTVADVDGSSFWGGRTFTRDRGSVMLDNHGRQEHVRWLEEAPDRRMEELSWTGPDGAELLREERTVSAALAADGAWVLRMRTRLRNTAGRELVIGSPATNGRPGAGYGGLFWRAPIAEEAPSCFGSDPGGEPELHGSRAEWVALSGTAPAGGPWTLVFAQTGAGRDPWFIRAAEYPGVGTSLAWEEVLRVADGDVVERGWAVVVADGHLPAGEAGRLVAGLPR